MLVESNDALYANDEKFIEEIHKTLSRICEQIIQSLKDLATNVMMYELFEDNSFLII